MEVSLNALKNSLIECNQTLNTHFLSFINQLEKCIAELTVKQSKINNQEQESLKRQRLIDESQFQLNKNWDIFNKERAFIASQCDNVDAIVSLNVGGTILRTTKTTLTSKPGSMLEAMFSGRHPMKKDKDGNFFLDRDPDIFIRLLSYLRSGNPDIYIKGPLVNQSITDEFDYFCISPTIIPKQKIPAVWFSHMSLSVDVNYVYNMYNNNIRVFDLKTGLKFEQNIPKDNTLDRLFFTEGRVSVLSRTADDKYYCITTYQLCESKSGDPHPFMTILDISPSIYTQHSGRSSFLIFKKASGLVSDAKIVHSVTHVNISTPTISKNDKLIESIGNDLIACGDNIYKYHTHTKGSFLTHRYTPIKSTNKNMYCYCNYPIYVVSEQNLHNLKDSHTAVGIYDVSNHDVDVATQDPMFKIYQVINYQWTNSYIALETTQLEVHIIRIGHSPKIVGSFKLYKEKTFNLCGCFLLVNNPYESTYQIHDLDKLCCDL